MRNEVSLLAAIKNYFKNRRVRKIEKNIRVIKNPKAIREDRIAALDYFNRLDDATSAVPALLQRFEYSLEHGINDAREKEAAMEGILRHGDKALPLVIEHLRTTLRIAWPIKLVAKLADEETVAKILFESLNYGDVSFDQAVVDKNYDILCYLADYHLPDMVDRLLSFLKDPDERVRFAAVEVVVGYDDPRLAKVLEPYLADETSENRRIRNAVINAFIRHKWKVEDPKKFADVPIIEGVFVSKSGQIERRA